MSDWTVADSEELYQVPGWGLGLFRVSAEGHLCMHADGKADGPFIDLKQVADDMRKRGVELPLLVRFTDVIKHRVDGLVGAFAEAAADWDYKGRYRPVFPIKVNPQSHVMRDVMTHGLRHHVGLEAGSKPELMAVLALLDDPEALIICNGYKDETYIRMALLARKLGHECVIVVEKPDELDTILKVAEEIDVRPMIGVRARLNAVGSGRWGSSTGDKAKFGLGVPEILDVVARLRAAGRLDCLELLHFHIGSQISQIRAFKTAVREGARVYSELRKLGAPMRLIDCGGGLGVDYDGNGSGEHSSVNYNMREYASALIGTISEVCAETQTDHPDVVTEAGRAMVAHSSVLLLEVLGTTRKALAPPPRPAKDEVVVRSVEAAWEIYDGLEQGRLVEGLHEAQSLRRDANTRFNLGLLDLEQRASVERMYWAICQRILELWGEEEDGSDEIDELRQELVEISFCNFSVFQSLPDIWAIDQLFPIVPIQRLGEEPTRRTMIADLTCDSDGKIDSFIGHRESKPFLQLHALNKGERYILGVFLAGAYQEILGDLHNLFGDTHAIHVQVAENRRGYQVLHLDEGDIVEEVLTYVHHRPKELVRLLRSKVESATEAGEMSMEDGAELVRTFVRGLDDYTYLAR